MNDACFQLKGSAVSTVVLELYHYDSAADFADLLGDKVRQAPQFFQQSPVVISLEKLAADQTPDFGAIVDICREFHLQPMALRGVPEPLIPAARETGLALVPSNTRNTELDMSPPAEPTDAQAAVVVKKVVEERLVSHPTKIITRPVRSGQQVYSEGDLVVLSQVSAGAEVLAGGDIHIYGALRGRALAGVNGDTGAKIFCQNLSAELVAIAGNFILSDSLQKKCWQESAYVCLEGENLQVHKLP